MWAVRAAVRPASWLFRVARGCGAPRAAPPLSPCPERALAAFRGGLGCPEGRGGGGRGPRADGRRSRTGGKEGEEEPEAAEEEEEEEEELLRRDPLLPAGTQRVCLVHPDVKWGPGKPPGTRAEWQVVEAQALVHTLDGWSVVDTVVVPTKTPDRKLVFGRGTLERLTEKIRGSPEITAVFLNVERMAAPTKKELEAAWGVQVFDRFTVVLHIFRCNARTKEARLQVALAELPLLRSHLKNNVAYLGGRGRDSRHIMGSGESFMQVQERLLKDKEAKIRKALDRLRRKKLLLGQQRRRREFPVVSVVGYTNCGKTTLIKALTGDAAIQPRDQLFATLDVTAHAGRLPSRLTVIYMDTIGFLSQLPHSLVESFSATLEDVGHSVSVEGQVASNTHQQEAGPLIPTSRAWVPSSQHHEPGSTHHSITGQGPLITASRGRVPSSLHHGAGSPHHSIPGQGPLITASQGRVPSSQHHGAGSPHHSITGQGPLITASRAWVTSSQHHGAGSPHHSITGQGPLITASRDRVPSSQHHGTGSPHHSITGQGPLITASRGRVPTSQHPGAGSPYRSITGQGPLITASRAWVPSSQHPAAGSPHHSIPGQGHITQNFTMTGSPPSLTLSELCSVRV
ncbi:putative GTP-binding protein 6 isoform X3 [Sagmatias obliquidens]|uniref:putative GTP-binding protein 6 isoform X3 n=1 Tax=Sagmatias obliquidens TaxID=3371155 RepID=UPI000F444A7A|nr:putative GTP-binding protein 6 isoform X3 [Lagenorhynchus obliquidens]